MKLTWLMFLLIVSATASAQVYRQITPEGKVIYSDRPAPGSEEVHVAPLQTYDFGSAPGSAKKPGRKAPPSNSPKPDKPDTFNYTELEIVSPANGEGIRANAGNVTVKLSVTPALRPGHFLVLTMDGKNVGSGRGVTQKLSNVPRGTHTLKAKVVDAEGNELRVSEPSLFHLHRVAGG